MYLQISCRIIKSFTVYKISVALNTLKAKNYQNRKVGIIENGSWAPSAGRCMKEMLAGMKNIEIIEPMITIKSSMKKEDEEKMKELAKQII